MALKDLETLQSCKKAVTSEIGWEMCFLNDHYSIINLTSILHLLHLLNNVDWLIIYKELKMAPLLTVGSQLVEYQGVPHKAWGMGNTETIVCEYEF